MSRVSPRIVALAMFGAAALMGGPTASMPLGSAPAPSLQPAAWVCDAYGRCWDSRGYEGYSERRSYGYFDDRYDGYGSRQPARPPGKWEKKGFCPPGQKKKGNC